MRLTRCFEISDASHVGDTRRRVVEQAGELGFSEADQGRIAIVVTEVTKNLLKHAKGGQILVNEIVDGAPVMLQMLALDSGPGLRDARSAMRDGYSTSGTPGTGLGAIRRLSNRFGIYTWRGGTAVLSEFAPGTAALPAVGAHQAESAAIALSKRGEPVSGDGWRIERRGDDHVIMVVDGLGHGLQAADAANAALAVMDRRFAGLPGLMQDVHAALRATRGAAVGLARTAGGEIEFLGVGNVVCRVGAAPTADQPGFDKQIVSHSGTVGHTMRKTDPYRLDLRAAAIVILHTDGVSSRFALADYPGLLEQPAALIAGVLFQCHARGGADDATIVVLRPPARTALHA